MLVVRQWFGRKARAVAQLAIAVTSSARSAAACEQHGARVSAPMIQADEALRRSAS